MAPPSTSYEPRRCADSVLHRIVQDHLETFLVEAARLRAGEGVPLFVERAYRDFLRCGLLAGGFARLRCGDCGLDRLVAFSCCPCAPVRAAVVAEWSSAPRIWWITSSRAFTFGQWVLRLPHRLRYRLAWDHDMCRRVTTVFFGAVFHLLKNHARAAGLEQPRGGAVAMIQRFGGALTLNVHIHALVLDGVVVRDPRRRPGVPSGAAFHDAGRSGGAGGPGAATPAAARLGRTSRNGPRGSR
jgi:hypothetical protein